MEKPIINFVTSHAIKPYQLYIGFPHEKYLNNIIFREEQEIPQLMKYSRILYYFYKLVLWDIIENDIVFQMPNGCRSTLEVMSVSGDDFIRAVQNGAFRDVDFLASNFTGYTIVLKYNTRYGHWTKKINVSGKMKQSLIGYTNSGRHYSAIKIKHTRHYLDQVKEKFPLYTKDELLSIIDFGLKRYVYVNKMHADVNFYDTSTTKFGSFTGDLGGDNLKVYKRFVVKNRMKERVLSKFYKKEWDGFYYIGVTQEKHEKLIKQKNVKKFERIFLTKLKKELFHDKAVKHIWRVPYVADFGWKFFLEEYKTDLAEYIGENKYEVYHQCFLGRYNNGSTSPSNA